MCLTALTRILIVSMLVKKFADFFPARCCITMIRESATKSALSEINPMDGLTLMFLFYVLSFWA